MTLKSSIFKNIKLHLFDYQYSPDPIRWLINESVNKSSNYSLVADTGYVSLLLLVDLLSDTFTRNNV